MDRIIILIIILIAIYLFWHRREGFENWGTEYENINLSKVARQIGDYNSANKQNPWDNNFYGHRGWINPMDANNYANMIARDLQKPFPSAMNSSTPLPAWDPVSYRDVQLPDGQFVGQIQAN